MKLYDLVTSRIDPDKITTYQLSVSHVDENGNKDDGSGSPCSNAKIFTRSNPPLAFDGKKDSAADNGHANISDSIDESFVRNEQLVSADEIVDVNEAPDEIDESKRSAHTMEDSKQSPPSRIPKFIGFELQMESPPPGSQ